LTPSKPVARTPKVRKSPTKAAAKHADAALAPETDSPEHVVAVRRRPSRADGMRTQELILETAAVLLEEHGFEQLSTGLICKHAGLTPPALYRYFPNKYSVLFELAHSLLYRQHELLSTWIDDGGFEWTDRTQGLVKLDQLQLALRQMADSQKGAIWIMRGLRSVPLLLSLRVSARQVMLTTMMKGILAEYPTMPRRALQIPVRLLGEIIHLETELELDEPNLNNAELRRNVSLAVVSYIDALTKR